MFKKTILTLTAIAFSAGLLVASPSAEARKHRGHYKLNYGVNLAGVPASVIRRLCQRYSCLWSRERATYYKGFIRYGRRSISVFYAKQGARSWVRKIGLATKASKPWKTARISGGRIFLRGSWYMIRGRRTDGGYATTRHRSSKASLRRACLKKKRCRKALYRHARKYSKRSRYIPTSYRGKRRSRR